MLPTADGLMDDRLSKHCALLVGWLAILVQILMVRMYLILIRQVMLWLCQGLDGFILHGGASHGQPHIQTPSCCTSCHLMMGIYASAIYIYFWEKQNSISACGRSASMFIWFGKNILLLLLLFCLCCCWITKVVGWFCY